MGSRTDQRGRSARTKVLGGAPSSCCERNSEKSVAWVAVLCTKEEREGGAEYVLRGGERWKGPITLPRGGQGCSRDFGARMSFARPTGRKDPQRTQKGEHQGATDQEKKKKREEDPNRSPLRVMADASCQFVHSFPEEPPERGNNPLTAKREADGTHCYRFFPGRKKRTTGTGGRRPPPERRRCRPKGTKSNRACKKKGMSTKNKRGGDEKVFLDIIDREVCARTKRRAEGVSGGRTGR